MRKGEQITGPETSRFSLFTEYNFESQFKEGVMGEACSTSGEMI